MPELPEVRIVSKFLNKEAKNQTIKDIDVRYKRMLQEETRKKLIGQKIKNIKTHGKYIIFELTDYNLISHLRMEGKYYVRTSENFNKHDHVIFYLTDKILTYNDVRKFGTFDLRKKEETFTTAPLLKVAKEPFDIDIDSFYKDLKKRNVPLKSLLLNQHIIAGLGNIYADEVLFLTKLHPYKKGNTITKKDAKLLVNNSIDVLKRAISRGGTTLYSFKSDGEVGYFALDLLVHNCFDKPCKTCGTLIEKMKISGRTSYYCKTCQRM